VLKLQSFFLNVIGRAVSVCTQKLAYSVRFQARHLLYTPLFHRYDYWYLHYISANYVTIAYFHTVSIVLNFITALSLKVFVNLKTKTRDLRN